MGAAALALTILAGCAEQQGGLSPRGFGGPMTEGYLQLVSASESGVEIDADGRSVMVPATGALCIPTDAVQTSRDAVFVLIADCMFNQDPANEEYGHDGSSALNGILSVSVANAPLFPEAGATADALSGLAAYLRSPDGLVFAGASGTRKAQILEIRTSRDGLFALVEDHEEKLLPVASPRLWRGFVEVNKRMVLVTYAPFAAAGVSDDAALSLLTEYVTAVREANGQTARVAEVRMMRGEAQVADAGPSSSAPARAPEAPRRPQRETVIALAD